MRVSQPGTATYYLQYINGRPRPAVTPGRTDLEVREWIHRAAVHAHLEVQVGAEAVAGAADVPDHLSLRHERAAGDGDRRLMTVAGGEAVAVVNECEVAVTTGPAGEDDGAARGRVDRRPRRDADIEPRMRRAVAVAEAARAERAGDRPVRGPDEPRGGRPAVARRSRSRGCRTSRGCSLRRLNPCGERRALGLQRLRLGDEVALVDPDRREGVALRRPGDGELLLRRDQLGRDGVLLVRAHANRLGLRSDLRLQLPGALPRGEHRVPRVEEREGDALVLPVDLSEVLDVVEHRAHARRGEHDVERADIRRLVRVDQPPLQTLQRFAVVATQLHEPHRLQLHELGDAVEPAL